MTRSRSLCRTASMRGPARRRRSSSSTPRSRRRQHDDVIITSSCLRVLLMCRRRRGSRCRPRRTSCSHPSPRAPTAGRASALRCSTRGSSVHSRARCHPQALPVSVAVRRSPTPLRLSVPHSAPPPLPGAPFEQRLRCFAFLPQRINPLETEHVSIYIAPELPDVSAAASCFATRLNDTEPISLCDRCLRRCSSRRSTIVGSSRLAGDRR